MTKPEMHNLTKQLATEIEKQLPEGTGFVLILAESKFGKTATNMSRPLLSSYLAKCSDSFRYADSTPEGLTLIEIHSKKFNR
jgi:hypothetical protein